MLLEEPSPMLGAVFIGVIDRGTNVIQVRPTTLCPLNCIFCSVDAGPRSKWRQAEYVVSSPAWLAGWAGRVARYKGGRVEALIDGVGDPFTYPRLPELVALLRREEGVEWVAVETHGWALTIPLIKRLEKAGLDRVNLSLDTLDPEQARLLTGTPWYPLERIIRAAEYIARETSIDLHVTPVWVPGVNDEAVKQVVEWAYRVGAGKRWPPVTIQKYNMHRHGRRVPRVKPLSWREFWERLRRIEAETGHRVTWTMEEWGMERRPRIPLPYRRGSKLRVRAAAPGWMRGTLTAVTLDGEWLVTVRRPPRVPPGSILRVRVAEAYDTIIIAEPA